MGTVLSFSATRGGRARKLTARQHSDEAPTRAGTAQIYILPVVRIERHGETAVAAGAKARRREDGPSQCQA
ncbi:hypothetical protein [Roseixanthobacter pseudopolyaromaticivorans]|uniref:hypothetical protein n=1 Tax=Xanthobacteraceae TaxID=335928 RepID=UPI003726C45A